MIDARFRSRQFTLTEGQPLADQSGDISAGVPISQQQAEAPEREHLKLFGVRQTQAVACLAWFFGGTPFGEPRSFHRVEPRSADAQFAFYWQIAAAF
jgi:hypothetical protein